MIGLEYIVKLYKGTYKELAKKLELTPSTDWISGRRPIPKAKLEALSKLFKLDEDYFQKELNSVEKIELELDYLNRRSRRDSFEVEDSITDDEGNVYTGKNTFDPYDNERRILSEELAIEKTLLKLRVNLVNELFSDLQESRIGGRNKEIVHRVSNVLDESVPEHLEEVLYNMSNYSQDFKLTHNIILRRWFMFV